MPCSGVEKRRKQSWQDPETESCFAYWCWLGYEAAGENRESQSVSAWQDNRPTVGSGDIRHHQKTNKSWVHQASHFSTEALPHAAPGQEVPCLQGIGERVWHCIRSHSNVGEPIVYYRHVPVSAWRNWWRKQVFDHWFEPLLHTMPQAWSQRRCVGATCIREWNEEVRGIVLAGGWLSFSPGDANNTLCLGRWWPTHSGMDRERILDANARFCLRALDPHYYHNPVVIRLSDPWSTGIFQGLSQRALWDGVASLRLQWCFHWRGHAADSGSQTAETCSPWTGHMVTKQLFH